LVVIVLLALFSMSPSHHSLSSLVFPVCLLSLLACLPPPHTSRPARFIEVDEGNYECPTCSYVYEKAKGEFLSGIKSGTEFDDLPSDFTCPSCKTPKSAFQPIKKVIAGFADNQSYGIGTNSLTGGQKSALIYGGLAIFFLLFLSGYLIN